MYICNHCYAFRKSTKGECPVCGYERSVNLRTRLMQWTYSCLITNKEYLLFKGKWGKKHKQGRYTARMEKMSRDGRYTA